MLLENLENKKIILASQSPRRQELLKGLELDFEIRVKSIEEIYPEELKREHISTYLSKLKASVFQGELNENEILITSDTTVHLEGRLLEKPKDHDDAVQMLQSLNGKIHVVITGVSLTTNNNQVTFHEETEVTFANLTNDEIEYYVQNYKPFDKAGSYGIQELIGYIGIEKLNGCYYNVMGLPLHRLYKELKKL